jgi:hypothetical protein
MSHAGVIATAAIVVVGTLTFRVADRRPACPDGLVPAYLGRDELLRFVKRPSLPALLVVNPASGPGAAPDAGYRRAIATARTAGSKVLGYVPTTWGARPFAAAELDTARYREWYGVDGIFFDEAARDAAALGYYRSLAGHARARGARIVALNPGTVPARGYFDVADVVVTFEGPFAEYDKRVEPEWVQRIAPERIAHLVYAAPAHARRPGGRVYLTSGTLPHPWGTVAPSAEACA